MHSNTVSIKVSTFVFLNIYEIGNSNIYATSANRSRFSQNVLPAEKNRKNQIRLPGPRQVSLGGHVRRNCKKRLKILQLVLPCKKRVVSTVVYH